MNSADDRVAQGTAALAHGDWAGARRHFETAIGRGETGPALDGLSDALFWLEEFEPSLHHRSRAYALYREEGDLCRAARAALWLAMGYISVYGNAAAANGWLQRAERLLDEAGPCSERGWFEQLRGKMTLRSGCDGSPRAPGGGDCAAASRCRSGSVGLSEQGRALVSMGRVDEGMAMLDEAVAAATAGDARNLLVVGNTCCNMLSACDRAADFARAVQWCQVVDEFTRRYHCPPVFSYCRVVYSGILIATGRWDEAEEELKTALRTVEHAYPLEKVHSLSRLALLCVRRGRLEEAAQLLTGLETHGRGGRSIGAAAPGARPGRAGWRASREADRRDRRWSPRRAAAQTPGRCQAEHWERSTPAKLAAARLSAIAERSNRPPIQAMAFLALARVQLACDEAAHVAFEKASSLFDELGMAFDAAITRLEWARALVTTDREIAAEDARLALVDLRAARRPAARRPGGGAAAGTRSGTRPGPHVAGELTRRENEVLELLSHGLSNTRSAAGSSSARRPSSTTSAASCPSSGLRSRAEAVAWALRHPSRKIRREIGVRPDVRGLVQALLSSRRVVASGGSNAGRRLDEETVGAMTTTSTIHIAGLDGRTGQPDGAAARRLELARSRARCCVPVTTAGTTRC